MGAFFSHDHTNHNMTILSMLFDRIVEHCYFANHVRI